MLRISDDELWFYYWHYQNCKEQVNNRYCRERGIDYEKFYRFSIRYIYKQYSDPVGYEELVAQHKEYISSGMGLSRFCDNNSLLASRLSNTGTHLVYLEKIERLKLTRDMSIEPIFFNKSKTSKKHKKTRIVSVLTPDESKEMTFFNIPNSTHTPSLPSSKKGWAFDKQEVVEAKNDIEIVISKGVKVILSPSIESQTIIKIIELLKDI